MNVSSSELAMIFGDSPTDILSVSPIINNEAVFDVPISIILKDVLNAQLALHSKGMDHFEWMEDCSSLASQGDGDDKVELMDDLLILNVICIEDDAFRHGAGKRSRRKKKSEKEVVFSCCLCL